MVNQYQTTVIALITLSIHLLNNKLLCLLLECAQKLIWIETTAGVIEYRVVWPIYELLFWANPKILAQSYTWCKPPCFWFCSATDKTKIDPGIEVDVWTNSRLDSWRGWGWWLGRCYIWFFWVNQILSFSYRSCTSLMLVFDRSGR